MNTASGDRKQDDFVGVGIKRVALSLENADAPGGGRQQYLFMAQAAILETLAWLEAHELPGPAINAGSNEIHKAGAYAAFESEKVFRAMIREISGSFKKGGGDAV